MFFFKNLKIQYQIIIPMAFIFLFIVIMRIITTQSELTKLGDKIIKKTIINMPEKIENQIKNTLNVTAERATLLLNNEKLMKLFYEAQFPPENISKKDAKKKFTNFLDTIVKEIKKNSHEKTVKIHFHTPDIKSFYRCWKKKNGDDLRSFRKTIIDANKTKKMIKGMEVGRGAVPVRAIIPIKYNNKWIGTFEYIEDIKPIFKKKQTDNMTISFFIDSKTMIGARRELKNDDKFGDLYLVASNNDNLLKKHKKIFTNIIQKAYKGKKETLQKDDDYITSIPYKDYSGNIIGVILVHYDKHEIVSAKTKVFKKILLTSIFVFLIILTILFFISKIISKPILKLRLFFETASNGEADLTLRLNVDHNQKNKNEINKVAIYFNKFISNLQEMIIELNKQAKRLDKSSHSLKIESIDMKENSNDSKNKNKKIQTNLTTLNKDNESMTSDLISTNEDINQLKDNISNINNSFNNVEQDSVNMKEMILNISSAIEEINASVSEISLNTLQASDISKKATKESKNTEIMMKELNNSTQDISNFVNLIEEIASQTNLLALNATIEAASAGEAGKGFAVVANEIKNLANQTADVTKKITEQVSEIQEQMLKSVKSINATSSDISNVNNVNINIASTIEQQSTTISDISKNVQETLNVVSNTVNSINNVGIQIDDATQKIDFITNNVNNIMYKTTNINKELSQSMNFIIETTNSSIKLYESSEIVYDKTDETIILSKNLSDIVKKFKF